MHTWTSPMIRAQWTTKPYCKTLRTNRREALHDVPRRHWSPKLRQLTQKSRDLFGWKTQLPWLNDSLHFFQGHGVLQGKRQLLRSSHGFALLKTPWDEVPPSLKVHRSKSCVNFDHCLSIQPKDWLRQKWRTSKSIYNYKPTRLTMRLYTYSFMVLKNKLCLRMKWPKLSLYNIN